VNGHESQSHPWRLRSLGREWQYQATITLFGTRQQGDIAPDLAASCNLDSVTSAPRRRSNRDHHDNRGENHALAIQGCMMNQRRPRGSPSLASTAARARLAGHLDADEGGVRRRRGPEGHGRDAHELYRRASCGRHVSDRHWNIRTGRRYCIHDHVVAEDGPWYDAQSCWFNALFTRAVPAHAVEMTATLMDRAVARIVARHHMTTASP
jgi:hypothetical protein